MTFSCPGGEKIRSFMTVSYTKSLWRKRMNQALFLTKDGNICL
ncbi:Uncharacterized protein dnm_030850 [Desulfonema magnum]|uniref:Uncharacterized protein n=1 Tax=Desulfonema magnum TaxID=45655 RepID=A0A975GNP1_9BACT|nr:Uncharacterized protein dnm_030850 [Desulfonema magnum]